MFKGMNVHFSEKTHRVLLLLVLVAIVSIPALSWFSEISYAFSYTGQLDFGEGVVWQQALMIWRGEGYTSIEAEPFVVFHYPPVYHLLTMTLSEIGGISVLQSGRLLSIFSAVIVGGLLSWVASRIYSGEKNTLQYGLYLIFAFFVIFSFFPVFQWSLYMRTDMLALVLGLTGVLIVAYRPDSSPHVVISAIFCVAAVYTKQTAIFVCGAPFILLLITDRKKALIWATSALSIGLIGLLVGVVVAGPGFFEHLFLYNVNRFDLGRLRSVGLMAILHVAFIAIAVVFLRTGRSDVGHPAAKRAIFEKMIVIYLSLSVVPVIGFAKVGANINYMLEMSVALAVLTVMALNKVLVTQAIPNKGTPKVKPLFFGYYFAAVQLIILPYFPLSPLASLDTLNEERQELQCHIAAAEGIVISDNMIELLQAGKEVYWESAIFSELHEAGIWDQTLVVKGVVDENFAFFITEGKLGNPIFQTRYSAAVVAAMEMHYPNVTRLAGFYLRTPDGYLSPCMS